jgi:hypothetical protein
VILEEQTNAAGYDRRYVGRATAGRAGARRTERPVTDWIFGCESYAVYNPTLDASIVLGVNTDKRIGTEPTINVLLRDISDMLFPGHRVEVPVVG